MPGIRLGSAVEEALTEEEPDKLCSSEVRPPCSAAPGDPGFPLRCLSFRREDPLSPNVADTHRAPATAESWLWGGRGAWPPGPPGQFVGWPREPDRQGSLPPLCRSHSSPYAPHDLFSLGNRQLRCEGG